MWWQTYPPPPPPPPGVDLLCNSVVHQKVFFNLSQYYENGAKIIGVMPYYIGVEVMISESCHTSNMMWLHQLFDDMYSHCTEVNHQALKWRSCFCSNLQVSIFQMLHILIFQTKKHLWPIDWSSCKHFTNTILVVCGNYCVYWNKHVVKPKVIAIVAQCDLCTS